MPSDCSNSASPRSVPNHLARLGGRRDARQQRMVHRGRRERSSQGGTETPRQLAAAVANRDRSTTILELPEDDLRRPGSGGDGECFAGRPRPERVGPARLRGGVVVDTCRVAQSRCGRAYSALPSKPTATAITALPAPGIEIVCAKSTSNDSVGDSAGSGHQRGSTAPSENCTASSRPGSKRSHSLTASQRPQSRHRRDLPTFTTNTDLTLPRPVITPASSSTNHNPNLASLIDTAHACGWIQLDVKPSCTPSETSAFTSAQARARRQSKPRRRQRRTVLGITASNAQRPRTRTRTSVGLTPTRIAYPLTSAVQSPAGGCTAILVWLSRNSQAVA